jgi:hypothetical protein
MIAVDLRLSLRHPLLISMQHFSGEKDGFKSTGIRNIRRNMLIRDIVAAYSVAMARSLNLGALSHITRGLLTAQRQIFLVMTCQSGKPQQNRYAF